MIGPSSALTVHAGGGRKGVEQVEGAPQASVGRRRAVEGPAQVNPLVHGHSCRHGGGEAPPSRRAPLRAGLRRLRRHRSTNSSQTSSAVSRRSAPLAFAGAAALGARAETWSSGPYRALALGSVAAAAFPELAPSPPASAGHRGARPHGWRTRSPPVIEELFGWPLRARTRRVSCQAHRGGAAGDTRAAGDVPGRSHRPYRIWERASRNPGDAGTTCVYEIGVLLARPRTAHCHEK